MSRDYKNVSSRAKGREQRTPGWVWLLGGLFLGLVIASGVFIFGGLQPEQLQKHIPVAQPEDRGPEKTTPAPQANADPQQAKSTEKHYDFYTVLPEMEVMVPDEQSSSPTDSPTRHNRRPEPGGTYILQAGAFRSYGEADRLKARLALLGIEADIQTVSLDDKDTWHRVRIGPYQDLRRIGHIRTKLRRQGVNSILLKVSG